MYLTIPHQSLNRRKYKFKEKVQETNQTNLKPVVLNKLVYMQF